jgi:hypothetical protein
MESFQRGVIKVFIYIGGKISLNFGFLSIVH